MVERFACGLMLVGGMLLAGACGKSTMPGAESNTNWLVVCDSDADCGYGGACLCGACTKSCSTSSQCGEVLSEAECVETASLGDACGSAPAATQVCALPCEGAAQCEAAGGQFSCELGQ